MSKKKRTFFTPIKIVISIVIASIFAGVGLWLYLADKEVAVFNPQGIIASQQRDLIVFTLLLSVVVVVPVFVLLGLFAWKYREGGNARYTPDVEGNRWLEVLWWGIPIIIIGVLSVITWVSTHQLDPYKPIDSQEKALKVQVVALQWKWLFLYPEQKIATVNELKIPTGTPVNFELTADAPMSAFWIPNLGSQVYAMSGMSTKLSLRADRPGQYRGTNTNINGKGYAGMNFSVVAMPNRSDFDRWARQVEAEKGHNHMDGTVYDELVKPSEKTPVTYYHLHDTELYDKIVNKYMHHTSSNNDSHAHTEGSGH